MIFDIKDHISTQYNKIVNVTMDCYLTKTIISQQYNIVAYMNEPKTQFLIDEENYKNAYFNKLYYTTVEHGKLVDYISTDYGKFYFKYVFRDANNTRLFIRVQHLSE